MDVNTDTPHTGRLAKRMERAKALEERLRGEGRHSDAEVVRDLRLSASSAQGSLKSLMREAMKLRRASRDS